MRVNKRFALGNLYNSNGNRLMSKRNKTYVITKIDLTSENQLYSTHSKHQIIGHWQALHSLVKLAKGHVKTEGFCS